MFPHHALLALALAAIALPAHADPKGVWRTQPDQKGQVADVKAEACGPYICGTIIRVFDAQGQAVAAPTIGMRVFWNMEQSGDEYVGRAYVPAHGREYQGRLLVSGDRMTVRGCLGPVCQSQVWTRLE